MTFKEFLEDRTGIPRLLRRFFLERVTGGARWSYVFGSALIFLFVLQVVSGIVMVFHYSPSSTQAWGSIAFFQQNLRAGGFIRGFHHWAASFIVILAIAHLFQVFLFGAYQKPREFNWWTGVLLLVITLGLALTGYLLPWDQRGYWSTNVVTNIIGTLPVVGSKLREVLIGGRIFGSMTLTHFYGLHVLVLPFLFFLLLFVHLLVFRKHGVTPGWWRSTAELEVTTEPFWPRQVFLDLVFALGVLVVLVIWVIYKDGAPLGPPADPVSNYLARPEWYFLFLFQILRYFKGHWEMVGTLILPVSLLLFLLLLPLVDRSQDRSPWHRKMHLIIGGSFALFLFSFTLIPLRQDRSDPVFYYQHLEEQRQARAVLHLASDGIPPSGPLALIEDDPLEHGRKLFATHCMNCHTLDHLGGQEAPDLTGYLSQGWLEGFLKHPDSSAYYGKTKFQDMTSLNHLSDEEIKELAGYLRALSHPDSSWESHPGFAIYQQEDCQSCHGIPGRRPALVLDLTGYGSKEWLRSFIENSSQEKFYGEVSEMQEFQDILEPRELDHLIQMLSSLQLSSNDSQN